MTPDDQPDTGSPREGAPFFSILVCARNAAPYVRQCVESLLAQTFRDFECLFTDDASTDGTLKVFLDAKGNDPRFVRIRSNVERRTALPNLMDQIREARGEIVAIVDGDDWLEPDALERVAAAYAEDPLLDATYGNYVCEPGRTLGHCRWPDKGKEFTSNWVYGHLLTWRRTLSLQSFDEEPENYLDVDGAPYLSAYDVPLYLPIIWRARHYKCFPYAMYHYRRYHTLDACNDDATIVGRQDQKRMADRVFEYWHDRVRQVDA